MPAKRSLCIQRSLCTPLDAMAYTHEVLIISSMVGVFLVLLLASFGDSISSMSEMVGKLNQQKSAMLSEKISVISADIVDSKTVIVISNYVKYNSSISKAFFENITISCTSDNADPADMSVQPGKLISLTCDSITDKLYLLTENQNILQVNAA